MKLRRALARRWSWAYAALAVGVLALPFALHGGARDPYAIPILLVSAAGFLAFGLWNRARLFKPLGKVSAAAEAVVRKANRNMEHGDEFALLTDALSEALDPPRYTAPTGPNPAKAIATRERSFEAELSYLVDRCERRGEGAVLALLRIRFFERIAAAFGLAAAEHYAEAMAARLSSLYAAPTRVARLERNILVVLKIAIDPELSANEAADLGATAIQAFRAPVPWREQSLTSEAHVAIAVFPRDADSAGALLRAATAAMETVAIDAPPGVAYATDRSVRQARERLQMAERVRNAIASGEFVPYFQPVVDLTTHKVHGVELLARWPDIHGRMTEPFHFLQVAEDSNQITQLSTLLFTKAAQSMRAWRAFGIRIPVAVNVSSTMITPQLPALVTGIMERSGLPVELLEIEITETAIFHRPEEARAILRDLASLGLSLSLDDFGTGYSSLSYLLKLPISKIKIDQSFTSRILTDHTSRSIVRATIGLAHSLGHKVVAEGVADREISDRLFELGCTLQQGFCFSPGLPSAEAMHWIDRWEKAATPGAERLAPRSQAG